MAQRTNKNNGTSKQNVTQKGTNTMKKNRKFTESQVNEILALQSTHQTLKEFDRGAYIEFGKQVEGAVYIYNGVHHIYAAKRYEVYVLMAQNGYEIIRTQNTQPKAETVVAESSATPIDRVDVDTLTKIAADTHEEVVESPVVTPSEDEGYVTKKELGYVKQSVTKLRKDFTEFKGQVESELATMRKMLESAKKAQPQQF